MQSRHVLMALAAGALGWLASCSSGGAPVPPPPPERLSAQIVAPAGELNAGAAGQWQVNLDSGSPPYAVNWDFGGGAVVNTIEQAGVAVSPALTEAQMLEGNWTVTVSVTDAALQNATAQSNYVVQAAAAPGGPPADFEPAADTLYAIPLTTSAAAGEEVTIEIVSGALPQLLVSASGIGVVVEDDASYVAGSFNMGAAGGAAYDADGIWAGAVADGDFLAVPDAFINATDLIGPQERYDFNITPRGPNGTDFGGLSDTAGVLCNFKLRFAFGGTKTLRFEIYNGTERTFYQASSTVYAPLHWGNTDNDGSAAPNTIEIDGPAGPPAPVIDPPGHGIPAGFTPAADTLYAIPQAASAAVGEAVTIAVVTGPTAHPFKYMNSVGVTLPSDGAGVPFSFNVGELGGPMYGADGIWAGLHFNGIEQFGPNPYMAELFEDPLASLNGGIRYDFNVTPLCSDDVSGKSGVLFNFKVIFSTPGVKTFGLEEFNRVARTGYSHDDSVWRSWGNLANDGAVVPNSIVIE